MRSTHNAYLTGSAYLRYAYLSGKLRTKKIVSPFWKMYRHAPASTTLCGWLYSSDINFVRHYIFSSSSPYLNFIIISSVFSLVSYVSARPYLLELQITYIKITKVYTFQCWITTVTISILLTLELHIPSFYRTTFLRRDN